MKKLKSVLLVDDDSDCNFYHQRLFLKMNFTEEVHIATSGRGALEFLNSTIDGKHPTPDIIFLDINMPGMNGWEFIDEYEKLNEKLKARMVLVMLTTSLNPDDKVRAENNKTVRGFSNKFLNKETLSQMLANHFGEPDSDAIIG